MPPDPTTKNVAVLTTLQVSLTVLSASGLAKTDVFGKSDPFAMVLVNRRELGHTRTLFKTLDPCWVEPKETFRVHVAGNKARCSVVVQLWDEDLGGSDRRSRKTGNFCRFTGTCRMCRGSFVLLSFEVISFIKTDY